MLTKCANPACFATFRYFHEGKLFAIEMKAGSLKPTLPNDPEYAARSHFPRYYWLCSSCCCGMTIQADGDRAIAVVSTRKVPAYFPMKDANQIAG
jgi:hypothetical protein